MGSAKDIILRPIERKDADAIVKRVHYSGKVVNNSQFHIGVFYGGRLEGAMQFGPSLDKRKIQPLVSGTLWNEFIELNRMAFSEALPRNSESRALGVAMRILRKHAPHLQWVISFADGAQCGDGTIYRAAGFVLTGLRENNSLWTLDGDAEAGAGVDSRTSLTDPSSSGQKRAALSRGYATKGRHVVADVTVKAGSPSRRPALSRQTVEGGPVDTRPNGAASMRIYKELGYKPIPGFQLRYIYFLDPSARERLTVPVLPFSEIERRGAGMYRGQPRAASIDSDVPGVQPGEGGADPTAALQTTLQGE